MTRLARALAWLRAQALAREPGPAFLASFLVVSAMLFYGAYLYGTS